jgi:hypothetical protein
MKNYSEMTRNELAAARNQVWKDGDDPEEQAKIEKALMALDRRYRVMSQRALQPKFRNLAMCK